MEEYITKEQDNEENSGKKCGILKGTAILLWETAKIIIISLAIIIPVRYFLIPPFFVRGASMEPNFHDGEYLIIDELSYRLGEPERGDVIIFKYPKNPSQYYIKRIIGLPTETVEIKDGQIIVYNSQNPHGEVLDESSYEIQKTPVDLSITLKEALRYFMWVYVVKWLQNNLKSEEKGGRI
jgi:signal peptidase I